MPAAGFYECSKDKRDKRARFITMKDGPMLFAGLCRAEEDDLVCSICTVPANDLLESIPHDRMPAILPPETINRWFAPDAVQADLLDLLQTTPADAMQMHVVGSYVNRAVDDERCVQADDAGTQGLLF